MAAAVVVWSAGAAYGLLALAGSTAATVFRWTLDGNDLLTHGTNPLHVVAVVLVGGPSLVGLALAVLLRHSWYRGARWQRWWSTAMVLVTLLALASTPLTVALARRGNRIAVRRLESAADQIIAAVGRYEHDHGRPPATLIALVPAYLPAVPGTGLASWPAFSYRAHDKELFEGRWRIVVLTHGWEDTWLSYQPDRTPPTPWRTRWNQVYANGDTTDPAIREE